MQLKTGTALCGGKYKIERVLGQGGFGITYLATQDILERQVAIKEFFFREFCIRDADTSHVTLGTEVNKGIVERFLKKFIKEARTISTLKDPGIIQIYDVFRENGTAYYVMEYIEGESLNDMVKRRGALPEAEAQGYIRQVGEALTNIHRHNINHLDVKPSNIMVRSDNGHTVLIDFGVAKQYDSETMEGTTTTPVGISHGYSPVEQYRRNGVQSFSPQSDVYALAATLFKLLTGNTPPEAPDVQDMGLPVDELTARGVSPHISEAIRHAMLSRSMRTQSVTQFVEELNQSGATTGDETEVVTAQVVETPAAKPLQPQQPTARTSTRQQATKQSNKMLWVFIAAGLLLAGGITYVVLHKQDTKPTAPTENEATLTESIPSKVNDQKHETVTDKVVTLGSLGQCKYTGEVNAKGEPDGTGTATWSDGRVYNGPFRSGVAEGADAYFSFSNGDTFRGSFKNNRFSQGRYTIKADGSCFIGTYKNGQPDVGQWYDKNGKAI